MFRECRWADDGGNLDPTSGEADVNLPSVAATVLRCCTAGVAEKELCAGCSATDLPALLSSPGRGPRAAIVLLHPSGDRSRHQFLSGHLARMLPAMGVVVLRSDRRRMSEDRDAPYLPQVEDLTHGLDLLGKEIRPVPTGLWGGQPGRLGCPPGFGWRAGHSLPHPGRLQRCEPCTADAAWNSRAAAGAPTSVTRIRQNLCSCEPPS